MEDRSVVNMEGSYELENGHIKAHMDLDDQEEREGRVLSTENEVGEDDLVKKEAENMERSDGFDDSVEESGDGVENEENRSAIHYDSLLSKFDDYVAGGLGKGVGMSRALSFGLKVGDLVWGKVKSHPWWPGHIFNEAFASASVRRSRREGHVLVAFFGDSSYGWFDPAELVPFRQNFSEKARQTNSRNLNKAIEDAIDEASRRSGLGLACRCRKSDNFRPTEVNGYFAVDICDYEGFYSERQIQSSRDNFKPSETLAFIREMASRPQVTDDRNIDLIESLARVYAYRKAVFEEFDETYAEAFGHPSDKPSRVSRDIKSEPLKEPAQASAPLSGPLVIAESLGGRKGSTKPKDQTKKDRYLFKRRDEKNASKAVQVHESMSNVSATSVFHEGKSNVPVPVAYVEGVLTLESGDYVLQKRAPAVSNNSQLPTMSEIAEDEKPTAETDAKPSLADDGGFKNENEDFVGADVHVSQPSTGGSIFLEKTIKDVSNNIKQDGGSPQTENKVEAIMSSDMSKPKFTAALAAEFQGADQVEEGQSGVLRFPTESKFPKVGKGKKVGLKNLKTNKNSIDDLSSGLPIQGEKKKKRKKEAGSEASAPPKKRPATGKGVVSIGKVGGIAHHDLAPQEDSQLDYPKKDDGPSTLSNLLGTQQITAMMMADTSVPQLLSDLRGLALDPFLGVERNSPAITRRFFLKFRSVVYQKSLVVAPVGESECTDVLLAIRNENVKVPIARKPRPLGRPDDPTRGGRKRAPSDRQEEIATKKLKKSKDIRSLTAGKRAILKGTDSQKVEKKETSTALPKVVKADSTKKIQVQETSGPVSGKAAKINSSRKGQTPPPKTSQPTMLVMKFPTGSNIPSAVELKARFSRFGSLDHKSIRVFYTTLTCRVVFHYKEDAYRAYRSAMGNSTLFGNSNVRYSVRDVSGQETDVPDVSIKGHEGDASIEAANTQDSFIEQRSSGVLMQQQPPVQLKSILKKASGDEAAQQVSNGNGRASARVKFVLGGEESGRGGDQVMMSGNRNITNTNASFGEGSTSTSVATMDYNTKNFHKVIPPSSLPPILPLPPQFSKPQQSVHYKEALPPPPPPQFSVVAPRAVGHHYSTPATNPPVELPALTTATDISQQMLSLLTRCNDVVADVTSYLGYVPYHPL